MDFLEGIFKVILKGTLKMKFLMVVWLGEPREIEGHWKRLL